MAAAPSFLQALAKIADLATVGPDARAIAEMAVEQFTEREDAAPADWRTQKPAPRLGVIGFTNWWPRSGGDVQANPIVARQGLADAIQHGKGGPHDEVWQSVHVGNGARARNVGRRRVRSGGGTNRSPARGWRAKRGISSAERISRAGARSAAPATPMCC